MFGFSASSCKLKNDTEDFWPSEVYNSSYMVRKSKKILFVLNFQEYFRNYIDSQALSKISKNCAFLVSNKIFDLQIKKLGENKTIRYEYSKEKSKLHWHLFNINTKKFTNKSKTFEFRFARLNRQMQRIYTFAALPVIYNLTKAIILWRTNDQKLRIIIKRLKPDIILLPSSGYEGENFEIIKIAKEEKIPTLMLVDNWDNLCSKTILTRKPDYMAVWGKQTKEHAIRIHGMNQNNVFVLGTPRFIQYFKPNKNKLKSPYPFDYALFAGNALAFDELTTLRELDKHIEKTKQKLTIIYRPHPWRHPRRCTDTFFEYDFKHIKLDDDAKKYYKRELGDNYSPPLAYYPKLLANMEFMICPLSTMLIEGLLFYKPVYVLTYDDGIHYTNPKNAFFYYEHFKDIEKLPNLTIIDNFKNLDQIVRLKSTKTRASENIKNLDYYISQDTANYPYRLAELVNLITEKGNNEA